ncbi:putative alpha-1,6-mannanase (GH76 family) [Rhizobium petrolearium]|nr:putative alpha-1,6-mannanase (GH76 family) [Neorhizobium petrolearium]
MHPTDELAEMPVLLGCLNSLIEADHFVLDGFIMTVEGPVLSRTWQG